MSDIRKYFLTNLKKNLFSNKIPCKKIVNVFTDGSSINNGKKNMIQSGGIGIYIEDTKEKISKKINGKITNNICEIKACILGIKRILERESEFVINIYTDSEYVINSITKWSLNWIKNDWKKYDKQKKN